MERVIIFSSLIMLVSSGGPNIHTENRDIGKAQCTKDVAAQTLTTRFVTRLNGDNITIVYGKRATDQGLEFNNCTFNILDGAYLVVESTIDLTSPIDDNATNPCGFVTTHDAAKGDGFVWHLALRHSAGFEYAVDGDYTWVCYESEAMNTFLTAVLPVTDPAAEDLEVQNPTVLLTIEKQIGNIFVATSTCVPGDDMRLVLNMQNPSYTDYMQPWGMFVYDTRVARTEEDLEGVGTFYQLVGSTGCEEDPNLLEMQGGWSRQDISTNLNPVYASGTFQCKRFLTTDDLWFSTFFRLCFGTGSVTGQCVTSCVPRKKRSTDDVADDTVYPDFNVAVSVTVVEEEKTDIHKDTENPIELKTVLIITAAVAGFTLLLVLAAIVIFALRRRGGDTGSDVSSNDLSQVSSQKKLPVN